MSKKRITAASIVSAIAGLQLGAFCVVAETFASSVTELPFVSFLVLMQPIHLAIGLVEGLVTAAVLCFVYNARPELLEGTVKNEKIAAAISIKKILIIFVIAAVLIGGGLSLFVSSFPDGLEWSIGRVAGTTDVGREGNIHDITENIVGATAIMPDYTFAGDEDGATAATAVAGLVGGAITVALAAGTGIIIWAVRKKGGTAN
jgi:cobalt/nickel transport system permease protein